MKNDDYIVQLINKHSSKGIVIDTNVLLLLLIGTVDLDFIEKHKRTNTFTKEDFQTLVNLLSRFKIIITTPCVLTETDNLLRESKDQNLNSRVDIYKSSVLKFQEEYKFSNELVKIPGFVRFGIADISLKELAGRGFLILTSERPLSNYLGSENLPVINFRDIQAYGWL